MRDRSPIVVTFSLVNRGCRVAKTLNEHGVEDFRILGLLPREGSISHLVEVPDRKRSSLRIFSSEGCDFCRLLSSEGIFLISAKMRRNVMRCQVILKDRHSLRRLTSRLKTFPGFRITASRTGRAALTPRQESILLSALRMGYFDTPRGVGMRELAKLLGVSPATLTELLRRALKNLIIEHYSDLVREAPEI